jgi:hypothetical protein
VKAEDALELFERVSRPALNQFSRASCIEQTRILIEVLARFGVAAEPVSTKFHLVCEKRKFQFFASGDPGDYELARRLCPGIISRANDVGERTGYHVVALVERRILADLTTAQAQSPEFNFWLRPWLVALPFPEPVPEGELFDVRVNGETDNHVPFTARWIAVPDRSFEATPAWEPSHLWPLIDIFEAHMRLELVKRRRTA